MQRGAAEIKEFLKTREPDPDHAGGGNEMKILKILLLFTGVLTHQECLSKPILRVYTYAAMASKYGSGSYLKETFEQQCNCHLQWVPFDTGIMLLNRLKWEGGKSKADVVLGLESMIAQEALDLNLFEDLHHPITFGQSQLVPYSRISLAFVYDQNRVQNPPSSFDELIASPFKLILQDPRTSMTGTALVSWIRLLYGDQAPEIWKKLQPNILTFTRSWSEAYTLFQRGEGDLVLSYMSSPLYHEIEERKTNYQAAVFQDGNLTLYEMGGVLKLSQQKELGKEFIRFLRSPEGQNILATKGWQYPLEGRPKEWNNLVTYQEPNSHRHDLSSFDRVNWTNEWKESLTR